jgi:DNA-binding transcriptional MerR regulator
MKVTDIARRAGIGAHTVRYYVRAGLLEPRRDPVNNYKQFGEEHVARLRFIKGAQALGFSLNEVLGLLHGMDRGECPCIAMQAQLADKMLEVRARMEALAQRLAFMQRVYDGWGVDNDGSHDVGSLCRFLEEQAAHGRLPADPDAPLAAKTAPGKTGPLGDASKGRPRGRRSASGPKKNTPSSAGAAAALRFLQSEWNSPSTR